MRGDTLVQQQHPPTPPNAGLEYHAGLQQVAQYNTNRGYSSGEPGYGSPSSVAHEGIPLHASHADGHPRGLGLGIQYVRVSKCLCECNADPNIGWIRPSGGVLPERAVQWPFSE